MGELYVVATPIGNLQDISSRMQQVLAECDLVAAEDTRHSGRLLNHLGLKKPLVSYHKFNEKERTAQLARRMAEEDLMVALISDAGTPGISDPGYELVRAARELKVPVYGVSGPSALTTALSVSGIKADRFAFYGFLPRQEKERQAIFAEIKKNAMPAVVFYESPRRIRQLAETLYQQFPQGQACFSCDLTKLFEKHFFGGLGEICAQLAADPKSDKGEYTVVLAPNVSPPATEHGTGDQPLEVQLLATAFSTGCSLKEAVKKLAAQKDLSKNELYNASLRLKEFLRQWP